jgi:EmrB/QacA subfamily drug resistance transporter
MLALGAAILTEAFPREERGRALGFSGSIVSIGIIVGPTLGGLIIDALSWHWIFFVNIPVGIAGTFMVLKFVPKTVRRTGQRFDYAGALTLFVSLLSFLLALTLAQDAGLGNSVVLMLLGVFVIFLAVFHYLEIRVDQPMIDLALLKNSEIATGLTLGFTTFVAMAGTVLLMPFYLENVLGYTPRHVGLLLAVVPAAVGIVSPVSGTLSDRFGTRPMTVAGLLFLLVGLYAVSTLGENTNSLGYIIRFLPIGLGMGLFQSPNNSAIMGSAPQERLGVASGLLALTRTVGQTSGIAILGAIWASRVSVHSSTTMVGGTTTASAAAQVAALDDTFKIVVVIVALVITFTAVIGYSRRRSR